MNEPEAVTFAIISNAPAAAALLEAVCEELKTRAQLDVEPLVLRSYDKLLGAMRDGQVHIAWAPPLLALDLERESAAEIKLCSRRAGKTDYSCALFVPSASRIRVLDDLHGARVAWVAKESSAGYVVPRLRLVAEGLDPDTLFEEQTFRRTHEAVVKAVMTGDADVGATFAAFPDVDSMVALSSGWLDAGISNDRVRVVARAGPIPSDVIAVSTRVGRSRATEITTALRDLGEPVFKLLNADGFVMPDKVYFDELRRLVMRAHESRPQ
ncbi:MAG: phosphate/phosphite/phosphonate ABC transporter substrate-binding protein [Polyangiaceae bacterium]